MFRMSRRFTLIAMFVLAAARAHALTVVKTPYLIWVTERTAIVMWETNVAAPGRVVFTPSDGGAQTVDVPAAGTVAQARIDTLSPGTRYSYTVTSGAQVLGSGSFLTDRREAYPFSFGVFGDNQSFPDRSGNLFRRMAKRAPEFCVSVGDVTGDGTNLSLWGTELFNPGRDLFRNAPLYVAIGNHEGNSPNFRRFLPYPEIMTGNPVESRGHYFSYLRGNAAFLAFDAQWDMSPGSPQYQWMEATLSSPAFQAATWKFAYCHQPAWSNGWAGYDGTYSVRNYAFPLFQKYGVDMFFSGHTHGYERTYAGNIVHIINGGGGGGNETWGRNWPQTVRYALIFQYSIVRVNGDTLELTCYDNGDHVFDRFTLKKGTPLTLPDGPVIVRGPKSGAPGRQYVTVKYPAGGTSRVRYRLAVKERPTEDGFWEATPVMYDSSREISLPLDIKGAGTYHVMAQALDAQYRPSAWTEAAPVTIQ